MGNLQPFNYRQDNWEVQQHLIIGHFPQGQWTISPRDIEYIHLQNVFENGYQLCNAYIKTRNIQQPYHIGRYQSGVYSFKDALSQYAAIYNIKVFSDSATQQTQYVPQQQYAPQPQNTFQQQYAQQTQYSQQQQYATQSQYGNNMRSVRRKKKGGKVAIIIIGTIFLLGALVGIVKGLASSIWAAPGIVGAFLIIVGALTKGSRGGYASNGTYGYDNNWDSNDNSYDGDNDYDDDGDSDSSDSGD